MARTEDVRARRTGNEGTQFAATPLPDLDPLIRASNRLLEGWMAVGSEIFEFGKSRIDRSLDLSRAIAQSTSLNEAMDLQAQYTRSAVQDYFSEANKIADLSTRSLLDSLSGLQTQVAQEAPHRAEAAD